MIRLTYVDRTRSIRIAWACEELGLAYERIELPLSEEALRTQDMLNRNPFGKVPAIEDGDVTVFESGAILEYLLEKYGEGRLRPKALTPEWIRYQEWMHGSETLACFSSVVLFTTMRAPEHLRSEALTAAAAERAIFGLDAVERALNERGTDEPYICGKDFTAADIMLTWAIYFCQFFSLLWEERHPKTAAYFAAMTAREGWQKAL